MVCYMPFARNHLLGDYFFPDGVRKNTLTTKKKSDDFASTFKKSVRDDFSSTFTMFKYS